MIDRPDAPATGRNRIAILEVLRKEFAGSDSVLEIGSGTGQHAVFFAQALPDLVWQTSDRLENHAGIVAWIKYSGVANVIDPLELDVLNSPRLTRNYAAVFSANTAHIMSYEAVTAMFGVVAGCLQDDGVFCLYGPFNEAGKFTSASNEAFDKSLKSQNPEMGIRNTEDLEQMATLAGLSRQRTYAMPANNQLLVWRHQ